MLELQTPLLLEGDIKGALDAFGPGPGVCPEEWLLQNPGLVLNVLSAFRDSGADILPALTYGADVLTLSDYERGDEAPRLNTKLVELTAAAADQAAVAGGMTCIGHPPEPFGPLPYTDLIDTCAEQALMLAQAGAQCILLEDMPTLYEARAALLGARQAHLPVLLTLAVEEDGKTAAGTDPLAAMICLQELGLSAFGLSCRHGPGPLAEPLRRLAPYADVPLIARPGLGEVEAEDVSRSCWGLLAAGASILGGGPGATPDHMRALRILLDEFDYDSFPPPASAEDTAVLLSDDGSVYYLEEEIHCSPEIPCTEDMAAAILGAEGEGVDALLIRLHSIDDAYLLGQSIHLAHTAVCLVADSEEALEMGLLYYNGSALISSRSAVDEKTLELLAEGYGAVIL